MMDGQNDEQTDRRTDGQTDASDFIGCCPTNAERPKSNQVVLISRSKEKNFLLHY